MQFPIVREFKTDLFAENPENEVVDEPRAVKTSIWGTVIVPRHAPFFVDSLVVKAANGKELIPEVDYRIFRLMSRLTMLAGQEVSATVEILKPGITDVLLSYKVVGEFSLIDDGLLQLVDSSIHDDRPVEWDNLNNKPTVFTPLHHGHSVLYDIVGWQDMVEFINDIIKYVSATTKNAVETRLDYYFDLIQHFIALSRDTLGTYLKRHTEAYNSHGLTAEQVQLQNVDNFETARGNTVLQGREDMHVLVSGLKAIIDNYGFSANEFLPANTLPISRFGNTNFIPPTIDGSFEGLGGQSETAGICQEGDGSIVFLENRYDGRVDGLYYSVMTDPYSAERKREYSGYRYTHQRLESDNVQVNRIAQGSGGEVILMTDTAQNLSYVGLTFGSLSPTRHVLSRIDLSALMAQLPTGQRACDHISWMQVVLMGDWIYILFAHTYANRVLASNASNAGERRYRYFYRVAKADVEAQLPVTAKLVKLTYVDTDGVTRTNVDFFRLYTAVGTFPSYTRCYFPIKQTSGTVIYGNAYAQQALAVEIPDKPGKYLIKIIGSFLGSYASGKISSSVQTQIEATYEMDPETGVMTLLHKTPQPQLDFTNLFIDWLNPPANWRTFPRMVYAWDRQGLEVLPDGTIMASVGDYTSFPRGHYMIKPRDLRTRYEVLSKQWNTELGVLEFEQLKFEAITSPLVSGVKPKAFLLGNGGDFYTADCGLIETRNKLYYRKSVGRLASRSDVTNMLVSNVRSRPLTNTVWEVRGEPKIGGATITVPSAQLANYGTDLGYYQFCVGTSRRYLDLPNQSAEWTQPADIDAIKIITGHTTRINAQGLMEIVPTGSILYPSSIVEQLKRNVDNLSEMLKAPDVLVVICDPTGPMVDKFGWLPTLVWISWGRVGTTERHDTMLSITPTYSGQTNLTVTGFTVLDKIHFVTPTGAVKLTADKWDAYIAGDSNYPAHGSMRAGYYLDGNELTGFFDSGITAAAQGDGIQLYGMFRYANRNTKRWSTTATETLIDIGNAGGNAHRAVTPDNGVVQMIMHPESSGGAATIFRGSSYNALLGSVYPEVGWVIFFQQEIAAVFNGKGYTLPKGIVDLRDVTADPTNKTFYLYAVLREGVAAYEIGVEKRLETPFQVWVGTAVTNLRQILTVERFNVFTVNGHRVSDVKRGNSIPSSTGLVNTEGQFPWLRQDELLP